MKRQVHHIDFETLVEINGEVVSLTKENCEILPADKRKLQDVIDEVESRANAAAIEEAVPEKASLLVFKLASGQYFKAGNKRTALVAGLAFLRKNGYKIDLGNSEFVEAVDRVGVAAATLEDLYEVMTRLSVKSASERRGWDKAVKAIVETNSKTLMDLA